MSILFGSGRTYIDNSVHKQLGRVGKLQSKSKSKSKLKSKSKSKSKSKLKSKSKSKVTKKIWGGGKMIVWENGRFGKFESAHEISENELLSFIFSIPKNEYSYKTWTDIIMPKFNIYEPLDTGFGADWDDVGMNNPKLVSKWPLELWVLYFILSNWNWLPSKYVPVIHEWKLFRINNMPIDRETAIINSFNAGRARNMIQPFYDVLMANVTVEDLNRVGY
jgi:hypothetical protein